jgi:hypothetical protein
MGIFRAFAVALILSMPWGIAAANNGEDGFIWIDANTRIKVKPVGTAGGGATAPEKAPKKEEKKEKPAK